MNRSLIVQAAIESNKQDIKFNKKNSDEKMTQLTVKFELMFVVSLTFRHTHQPRRIHILLWTLPLWSRLTGGLHRQKEETL